ncbi:hypothetical protein ZHAS_00005090 [Anopheles sinensis]|uniref:Endonuclease/exonuclease/phosphatase domain-containing protein n=1 Tax=Anopheles sinensis TaxID=74873 RepID=A0A084VII0_ANOSI|nr:hypothetical protein ZHAS_00005090 [Anopheles sinensis]
MNHKTCFLSLEAVWVRIKHRGSFLHLGAIYIPPYQSSSSVTFERLVNYGIGALTEQLIIAGDLNLPSIMWSPDPETPPIFLSFSFAQRDVVFKSREFEIHTDDNWM